MRKLGWFLDGDWWQREAINEAADELDELRAARADDQKAFERLLARGRAQAQEIAQLRLTVGALVEMLVDSGAVDEGALRARLEGVAAPVEPATPSEAPLAAAATEDVTAVGPAPTPPAAVAPEEVAAAGPGEAPPVPVAREEVTAVGPAPAPVAVPPAPKAPVAASREPLAPAAAPSEPIASAAAAREPLAPAAIPREPLAPVAAPRKPKAPAAARRKPKAPAAAPREPKVQCAWCWHFVPSSRTRISGTDTVCDRCIDA